MPTPRMQRITTLRPDEPDAELTIAASAKAASQALRAGARAPLFTLVDACGHQVALEDRLREGPVVLQFRRGDWCSYGEDGLAALASRHEEILALGASALVIAPPCKVDVDRRGRPMPELVDVDMKVARAYGLAFELPASLRPHYERLGYTPPSTGRIPGWLVPLTATYLLGRDGVIVLAFIDLDYRNHYACASLIDALRALKVKQAVRGRGPKPAPALLDLLTVPRSNA